MDETVLIPSHEIDNTAYAPRPLDMREAASASTYKPNARIASHWKSTTKRNLAHEAEPSSCFCSYSTTYKFEEGVILLAPTGKLLEKIKETDRARVAYRKRISTFMANTDLDKVSMNQSSEREFWTFLDSQGSFRKGALFLLDNGNLRAVWKNETGDQIGLQFLGNGFVQYVMFKRRSPQAEKRAMVAGRDTLACIHRQFLALDLSPLISA